MEKFSNALIVIFVLLVICFFGYILFGGKLPDFGSFRKDKRKDTAEEKPFESRENFRKPISRNGEQEKSGEKANPTEKFSPWSILQLDPESGDIVKQKGIKVKENESFVVGRAGDCDFTLKNVSTYVGSYHLIICVDEKGYYAKDNDTKNGTYINDVMISDVFEIEDGLLIWLADCPVMFKHNVIERRIKNTPSISDDLKKADFEKSARNINKTKKFSDDD